jgi:hypothetical protein
MGREAAMGLCLNERLEPLMSAPRTVADVIREHVTLEVEGIDRMYLNVYQPKLQHLSGVVTFFRYHRGTRIVSSALMAPMSKAFIAATEAFVAQQQIPWHSFRRDERKDDVAARYHAKFTNPEGIYFVGKAQEKTKVFRTECRRNPTTGQPYPWLVDTTAMVNHYYFYGVDADFGPFFLKVCTYFPYNAKLYINGHEYLKQQLVRLLPQGFANRDLRNHWAPLLGRDPDSMTQGQMTYHLRRLRLHGLIERIPETHRYRVTDQGFRIAMFCTRAYICVLRPGLSQSLDDSPLSKAFRQLEAKIDMWIDDQKLAA